MIYKVSLQPRAESDICTTFDFLVESAPEAAIRWYVRLKIELQSLSNMPDRCPIAPESKKLGVQLRHLHFGKRSGTYRLIFRVYEEAREVHVLSVRHGARKPLEIADIE